MDQVTPQRTVRLVVGMEVHVQLATRTKLFCRCANRFGAPPDSLTCPVCLGLPGALPVVNEEAVRLGIRAALALGAEVAATSRFDRKSYRYPDLPKGYQITQYDAPLAVGGAIAIDADDGSVKRVRLVRAHLEEDTGTSRHADGPFTLLDFNRAGVPLLEVVSRPELSSGTEAVRYVRALREILVHAGVSTADMERGRFRVEPNVNLLVTEDGAEVPTPVVELKNLNSLASVERAIDHEAERQLEEWRERRVRGEPGAKSTRGFDEVRGVTVPQRGKEEAEDYRYFPEPDLPPLTPSPGSVERERETLPEPPRARRARWIDAHGISAADARTLCAKPALAGYFDAAAAAAGEGHGKATASWILVRLLRGLDRRDARDGGFPVAPEHLGALVGMIGSGEITRDTALREVWPAMLGEARAPAEIVAERGLGAGAGDVDLEAIVGAAAARHPEALAAYRAGKDAAIGPIVGEVMRRTRGRADARRVREMVEGLAGEP